MTKKLEFEVTFNKTVSPVPKNVQAYIDGLKSLEGKGKVTWELYSKSKGNKQNRYFWGVLLPHFQKAINKAMDKKGNPARADLKEAEDILRDKFFYYYKTYFKPVKHKMSLRNLKWDKREWEEKVLEIRHWTLHTLEYDIPEPNQEDYNE